MNTVGKNWLDFEVDYLAETEMLSNFASSKEAESATVVQTLTPACQSERQALQNHPIITTKQLTTPIMQQPQALSVSVISKEWRQLSASTANAMQCSL